MMFTSHFNVLDMMTKTVFIEAKDAYKEFTLEDACQLQKDLAKKNQDLED